MENHCHILISSSLVFLINDPRACIILSCLGDTKMNQFQLKTDWNFLDYICIVFPFLRENERLAMSHTGKWLNINQSVKKSEVLSSIYYT